ncbi:M20 aminoacylase family protein [Pigmentiphaga litoralis]|uniref:M20 aminoacylase family protein n=1 Tax=Pigmentiphaga litoralis TaxID=516702 RepID=UPI003570ACCD
MPPLNAWKDVFHPYATQAVALRQHIHQRPELGFQEHETAALVAGKLRDWGYAVTEGVGSTGVVGVLRVGDGNRSLGIRADMDALPIQETTGLPYGSVHHGVMHACGHDGHTAMLLGAAHYLADTRRFSGTLNVIFQPAEEGLAGARRMMDDGLFTRFPCDAVFGMHNIPGLPQGKLVFAAGPLLASNDRLTITVRGKSAHGAEPQNGADALVGAAAVVMALQTVVSRNLDPQSSAVVTVASLHAGKANNVIADEAVMQVTIRTHERQVRDTVLAAVHRVVRLQAESFGLTAEIVSGANPYPPLINTVAETRFAQAVAVDTFGVDKVATASRLLMNSEDFAFMLEERPGSYLLIGNGDGPGSCMVHHPGYDFNDANIEVGVAYWSRLAEQFLTEPSAPGHTA